jgi:hypothetical protein
MALRLNVSTLVAQSAIASGERTWRSSSHDIVQAKLAKSLEQVGLAPQTFAVPPPKK